MCDLTTLSGFPSAELAAEFARMFGPPSPAPAGPSRDAAPDPSPLARAGAGDPLSEVAPCS